MRSSFTDFLATAAPQLLPDNRRIPAGDASSLAPHGTTIVAAAFPGGVVMAGDRRATLGNLIANRDMEKVFPADGYSVVGIAGTAGVGLELVRLYRVELEHYEKIEGTPLSLEGKANRLSAMIRGNLGAAMQGLAVLPIFGGYDLEADLEAGVEPGRIYGYDIAGGCYPEERYHAVGSGSLFAKATLKRGFNPNASADETAQLCLDALYDAADEDSATGGPDVIRKIFPTVLVVEADGVRRIPEESVATMVNQLLANLR